MSDSFSDPLHKPHHPGVMLVGLAIGAILGLTLNVLFVAGQPEMPGWLATMVYVAEPIGKVFLRLMSMVVVPLVLSALALAIVNIGDPRKLGRLGVKTLLYTAIFSGSAVLLGVGLVNAVQPGKSLSEAKRKELEEKYKSSTEQKLKDAEKNKNLREFLVDLIPENPLQEMVGAIDSSSKGNGMLAVMVFALICGLAMTTAPEKCQGFISFLEGLNHIAMTVIEFAMKLAPLCAGCLVFSITAQLGLDVIRALFAFALTVIGGLLLQLLVVYPAVLLIFARKSPIQFFRQASEAMLVAFGTSSSNATLPTALRVAEEDLKLPPNIASFVLTIGATGNQNGTALFEGVTVLFLAQMTNTHLEISQQLQVVLMSVFAGIGTAGVPGGSIPLVMGVLKSVKVNEQSIGVILGVDRLLDMCRTVVNVTGDLAVACCVARGEEQEATQKANP
jgi:DAACS family dicarboxylate/amino acid:cation (Na+ or H+) symporter